MHTSKVFKVSKFTSYVEYFILLHRMEVGVVLMSFRCCLGRLGHDVKPHTCYHSCIESHVLYNDLFILFFFFTTQDGSWGCFDELQMLSREAMAMVLDHTHAIMAALRAKQEHCMLGDGEQVTFQYQRIYRENCLKIKAYHDGDIVVFVPDLLLLSIPYV